MGLFDFIKKQFIDVIQWNEESNGVLAFRFPVADQEIQNGAKLTVRESQLAMFVNEGEIADVFQPGAYTLSTKVLPILTSLKNWDKAFEAPFKSDVYFFSTREQLDQKWGTTQPLTIRDKEFGAIRLRAHGSYSYRVKNPAVFFRKVSGTRETFTTDEMAGQLRGIVMTALGAFLGNGEIAFLDMAAQQSLFSQRLKEALTGTFAEYGLGLDSFMVQSLSLPEEVQAYLDKSSSMRVMGDMKAYSQFQSAEAITLAAKNEGGAAGVGASMAAGMVIGENMMRAMQSNSGSPSAVEDPFVLIEKLHGLMHKGIISKEEFEAKKTALLQKIK